MSHSLYSPSGASLWTKCLKSLDVPDTSEGGAESDKGTVVHKIGEQCLHFGFTPLDYLGSTIDGEKVDQKMIDDANMYVNFINSLAVKYQQRPMIEKRVQMLSLSDDNDVFGTFDSGFTCGRKLHICDYKNGFLEVEIENNLQFIMYAIGYLDEHLLWNDIDEIEFTVIQPNSFHINGPIRSFTCDIDYLRGYERFFRAVITLHKSGGYDFITGEHCKYCHRAPRCKAHYLSVIDMCFTDGNDLNDDELIAKFKLVPMVTKSMEAVQEEVFKLAKRGVTIPDHKLVKKRAKTVITDEDSFVNTMVNDEKVDVNSLYQFKLKPISQLKKVVREELLESYLDKPDTGETLVPMSDSRRAISGLTAFPDLTKRDPVPPPVTEAFKDVKL